MKRFRGLVLSVLLVLTCFTGCSKAPVEKTPPAKITILHTNDVHGGYSAVDALSGKESETIIGHDTIAAVRDSYAEETPTFLLDGGDAVQGIFFVTANQGESAIEIMNAAGYDAMNLGNHEFDYGEFRLGYLIGLAEFPVLTHLKDDALMDTENLFNYTVIEKDGVRLGVFGITTPETQFKSDGGFGKDFGSVETIVAHAQDMVKTLRETEKVDYVVCLAHLGIEDMGYGTSYDIRDNVEGIDLIIDGHSHTKLEDIENVEGKTFITSTGSGGNGLGKATLEYVDDELVVTTELLVKENLTEYTPVAEVSAVIESWAQKAAAEGNVVVAQIPFDITVARANERTGETVMGNIITDAMREASGAEIAMQNGGGIRDQELTTGDVTKAQLITILPYGNVLQVAEVKGSVIIEALEVGVATYPEANGGFPHVSGITYEFDPSLEPGSRITSVMFGEEPLDPERVYTFCTNDFTAAGGDLYTMLVEPFSSQLPLAKPELMAIDQALIAYLDAHQAEISNKLEGRITAK